MIDSFEDQEHAEGTGRNWAAVVIPGSYNLEEPLTLARIMGYPAMPVPLVVV